MKKKVKNIIDNVIDNFLWSQKRASTYFDVTTIQLSLIVTATDKETCASLSTIISCHLSRLIGLKISY